MAAEACGGRAARRMIQTGFAKSPLAILADEQAGLGRLRETPAGEVSAIRARSRRAFPRGQNRLSRSNDNAKR